MRPRLREQTARSLPRWLTLGLVRLIVLLGAIVLVGMLRPRLSPHSAGIATGAAAGVAALAGLLFLRATRRLARHVLLPRRSERVADAILLNVRRTGLALLALAFFLFWTFVYVALWAIHPHQAFTGLDPAPRFADFFYYAVTTSFVNPPNDIVAHSRGVRSATMIEMMTAFALFSVYVSSFIDWARPAGGGGDGKGAGDGRSR